MRSSSPSGHKRRELVFGRDDVESDDEWEEDIPVPINEEGLAIPTVQLDEAAVRDDKAKSPEERQFKYQSAYVHAMSSLIREVSQYELHLFTMDEKRTMASVLDAQYEEQFVLSRLVLRKPGWHPISSLEKWKHDIGEQALLNAITSLSEPFEGDEPVEISQSGATERKGIDPCSTASTSTSAAEARDLVNVEIFDLTVDETEQKHSRVISSPPTLPINDSPLDPKNLKLDYFLEDSRNITLEDAINCLPGESLRKLARIFKIQLAKNTNAAIVEALLKHAQKQTVLGQEDITTPKKSSKKKHRDDGYRQTVLPFVSVSKRTGTEIPRKTQQSRLKELVMKDLGTCVRMNPSFRHLIHRLHLICYRCTESPSRLLLPHLLTHFRKRSYPPYLHERCGAIWRTREELLEYEYALGVQARLEEIMNPPKEKDRDRTPLPKTPVPKPKTPNSTRQSKTPDSPQNEEFLTDVPPELTGGQRIAFEAKRFIEAENIFEKWKELLVQTVQQEDAPKRAGLERFEAGWVYTRILSKLVHYLGQLKEYQYQLRILDALLSQRRWRRGKRAGWHERKALIKEKYLSQISPVAGKKVKKDLSVTEEARQAVLNALLDEEVGLVLRPSLIRRLRRVEKTLQLPDHEKAQIEEGSLQPAEEVTIDGVRIYSKGEDCPKLGSLGRPIETQGGSFHTIHGTEFTKPALPDDKIDNFFPRMGEIPSERNVKQEVFQPKTKPEKAKPRWTGKSLWRGKDGEPVTVEQLSIQHYESQGFKGFHSETTILTTIFSLLFWDILFDSSIPGAFETPFQIAPLDLLEDCFYRARKKLIDQRLQQIEEDVLQACQIASEHDSKFREDNTWCVGVRWDLCTKEELIEIIECIGGKALSLICRLFCEDFGGRCSGVPDLLVWNYEKKQCKLVEVKGPGDRASESQKLWLDTLLRAGTPAEICHVVDVNNETTKTPKGKKAVTKKAKSREKSERIVESEDEACVELPAPATEPMDVDADAGLASRPKRKRTPSSKMMAQAETDDLISIDTQIPTVPRLKKRKRKREQDDSTLSRNLDDKQEGGSSGCPVDVDALDDTQSQTEIEPTPKQMEDDDLPKIPPSRYSTSPRKENRAYVDITSPSKRRRTVD